MKDEVRDDVHTAAKFMVEMEHGFVDKMFEMGDLENLKKEDLKHFISKRGNEKLKELGYEPTLSLSLPIRTNRVGFHPKTQLLLGWVTTASMRLTHLSASPMLWVPATE